MTRLERALPSAFGGGLARVAEKFATGLGVIRHPARLSISMALSFPLWLCIDLGIWAVAVAFVLAVPFTGSFLVGAFLVLGVAVPPPGAVGGFYEPFRLATPTLLRA